MIAFYISAALLLVTALGVVFSKNALHSALWLITNLVVVAAIYAQLEAHFLAAAQVIVYAGAIMVLVVFLLMLLNVKVEQFSKYEFGLIGLATVVAVLFTFVGVPALMTKVLPQQDLVALLQSADGSGQLASGSVGGTKEVATLLFTRYLFAFELAGILLTAALIGAVMLGASNRKKRSQLGKSANFGEAVKS